LESVAKLPFNAEESSFAGGAGLSTTRHAGSCDGSGKARFDRMVGAVILFCAPETVV
jgi:hypothetical protein